jgi:hypothetical protein
MTISPSPQYILKNFLSDFRGYLQFLCVSVSAVQYPLPDENYHLVYCLGFFHFLGTLFTIASSAAFQILCRGMLGSNPELLRLSRWLSDALTTRLDLVHLIMILYLKVKANFSLSLVE